MTCSNLTGHDEPYTDYPRVSLAPSPDTLHDACHGKTHHECNSLMIGALVKRGATLSIAAAAVLGCSNPMVDVTAVVPPGVAPDNGSDAACVAQDWWSADSRADASSPTPCGSNTDCLDGFCVPTELGRRCADVCGTTCPDGWACRPVAITGGDETYVCLPEFTQLCFPCAADGDCNGQGARPGQCVDFGGVMGRFCAVSCDGGAPCPSEYVCAAVGSGGPACLPASGACECSPWAVEQLASTPCFRGSCAGTRRCLASGLTACDAPEPVTEVCNGIDDDCDGETDRVCESTCADLCEPPGPCAVDGGSCDDGDPCTSGDVCGGGACTGVPAPCAGCLLCDGVGGCATPVDTCVIDEACVGAGTWAPGNACLVCIPSTSSSGWTPIADGVGCDDGDACTAQDHCASGACVGAPVSCLPCEACGATGACTPVAGWCVIDGACYLDGERLVQDGCLACVPAASASTWTAVSGWACSDGDPCTLADSCDAGACVGTALLCDALSDDCHLGVCEGGGCLAVDQAGWCDDGDACTEGDVCSGGACLSGPPTICVDGEPCTDDACESPWGCFFPPSDSGCDDGEPCTSDDTCIDGKCAPVWATDCDDGSPCTADWCEPGVGCQHTGECCGSLGVPCPEGFTCSDLGSCEDVDEVLVPAGAFWMGCATNPTTWCPPDAQPLHLVTLGAFALDRTEVTRGAWAACVSAGACPPLPPGASDQHPVQAVAWADAAAYCTFAGKRLPTEAEWEKAAGGGCETIAGDCKAGHRTWPWGEEPVSCAKAIVVDVGNGAAGCGLGGAAPVGSRPAGRSPYGPLDMAGNVREWVSDWYRGDAYCHGPAASCAGNCTDCLGKSAYVPNWADPTGPATGTLHVARGGAYIGEINESIAWRRVGCEPAGCLLGDVGLRCARSL